MSEENANVSRDEEQARQMVQEIIARNPLCHKTEEDAQMIRKAFELANEAHRGMRRRSGELYIFHPVAVAKIVAEEIGLGPISTAAALLHDVVEDTEMTLQELEQIFNPTVAQIVDGLTKLDSVIDQQESLQVENFRKLLISMVEDVRIILIKLADRLHNMRTLEALPDHKRYRISAETLYIYAPIANRLGLYAIKTELEDLSLKNEQPKVYQEIYDRLQAFKRDFQVVIDSVMTPLRMRLDARGYKYEIKARTKSIYSIWRKMENKGVQFDEIYDIIASRVVFEPREDMLEKTQCWDIYSIITDLFRPNPDRLRDWVSTPKSNGYEALHTTVMSPEGRWIEIQIRSRRMDEIAERGLAAHWKYKGEKGGSEIDAWLEGLKKMLDTASQNSMEFMDTFKLNLFSQEIMIFTPQGDMRIMPVGSTALDFAFGLHSKIGFHCIGAKVNYKLEPLSYVLKSGDQVEIITSDNQKPKYEWLNFCTTAKAKTCIREAFKDYRRQTIEKGEQMVADELAKVKLTVNARILSKMLTHYKFDNRDDLYFSIGSGVTNIDGLEKALRQNSTNKWIKFWHLSFGGGKDKKEELKEDEDHDLVLPKGRNVVLTDEENETQQYSIAPCCHPIPGDEVVAYMQDDGSLVLHSRTCPKALQLMSSQGNKIVSAQWESHKVLSYLVQIEINGIDRQGIVAEITRVIANEMHVKMRSVNFEAHDGIFVGNILLYTYSADDLGELIETLGKVKGVHDVNRKDNSQTKQDKA